LLVQEAAVATALAGNRYTTNTISKLDHHQEARMERRPTIGVTTQTLEAIPDQLPACWVMSQRYIRVLAAAGAVPWIVPLVHEDADTLRAIYEQLDGVFLPGGVDIDPQAYREERHPFCGRTDPARDATELMLARWALHDRKPLLAVCRGVQVLNVACGGTLFQDLSAQLPHAIKHDYFPTQDRYSRDMRAHDVWLADGARLAGVLGRHHLVVNSMHHQGIKDLAPGLVATAFAPDGLIEGVEASEDQFLMGVQWHPEDLVDCEPCMWQLFNAFMGAALGYRDGRGSGCGSEEPAGPDAAAAA
jgi:putative glutamine amidotransferase